MSSQITMLCVLYFVIDVMFKYFIPYIDLIFIFLQRIPVTVNNEEQKRLLMDLDVSMRSGSCPYTVQFYGALFREVIIVA